MSLRPSSVSVTWGRVLAAVAGLCAAAACAAPPRSAAVPGEPLPGDYRVVGGKVDRGTYTGWRIFHTSCHGCHGVGGVGTAVAPDLTARIKDHTPRGFATKVLTSYRIVSMPPLGTGDERADRERMVEDILKRERSTRGQVLMPAWESDGQVPPHVLDLYAYLSARADGAIGPGRPGVIGPAKRRKPAP
jgi:mono/diheme cytochrome c family protein